MRRTMLRAEGIAKRSVSGKKLQVRTGRLRASIRSRVIVDGPRITGILGVENLVYGPQREFGGTIRAKKPGGFLTIPLKAAKTAAGVPRFTAREADDAFPGGTFVAKSRQGNLLLFGKRGAALVPLFLLKKEVTQKGAFFLTAARNEVQPHFLESMQNALIAKLISEGRATTGAPVAT